jgi:hypothetical protein
MLLKLQSCSAFDNFTKADKKVSAIDLLHLFLFFGDLIKMSKEKSELLDQDLFYAESFLIQLNRH